MPRKILIYGESWEGTLPQLLYSDLKMRGFEVQIFDYAQIMPGLRNRTFFSRLKRRLFYFQYEAEINKKFLDLFMFFKPETVLVVKGLNLKFETLYKIKKENAKLVNWNPDDFFNMKNSNENLIKCMGIYDSIVSSRKHLFDKYYKYGAKKVVFIDWYYVDHLHFSEQQDKHIKLSFVGSWSEYREEFIENIGKPFVVRGGGWEKSSQKFRKNHDVDSRILTQREMSQFFASSEVNLNILTPENDDLTNLRFFEVAASGGLLLTERNKHSLNLLSDKTECLMYSSLEEIREILDTNFNYRDISTLGMNRILNDNHSFRDRINTLLENKILF